MAVTRCDGIMNGQRILMKAKQPTSVIGCILDGMDAASFGDWLISPFDTNQIK